MSIPSTAAALPTPPANEATVTFSSGSPQTWNLDKTIEDGKYAGKVKSWKRILDTYQGVSKEQFVFLISIDGREGDGELAYKTGVKITGHPKEKLTPFLRDALKLPLPTPQNPTLPDPVGRPLTVLVSNEPSTREPSKSYPKIVKVSAAA